MPYYELMTTVSIDGARALRNGLADGTVISGRQAAVSPARLWRGFTAATGGEAAEAHFDRVHRGTGGFPRTSLRWCWEPVLTQRGPHPDLWLLVGRGSRPATVRPADWLPRAASASMARSSHDPRSTGDTGGRGGAGRQAPVRPYRPGLEVNRTSSVPSVSACHSKSPAARLTTGPPPDGASPLALSPHIVAG